MMMMIMMNMSGMENHPTHIQSCLFPDIYFKGRSFLNFQFLPLFLSAENQQTPGFLNLLNRIFVISLANPTFGKSGNMKNLKIDQLTWRNQQKTHGTCEKHGHFVSRPRIFFWSPDPLAAPQASIPKGPKTIVSPLDLGEINHYNNWKHHQKKHIKVMSHYFSEMLSGLFSIFLGGVSGFDELFAGMFRSWKSEVTCFAQLEPVSKMFEIRLRYTCYVCVYIYIYT